jgi:hypothetical protein
MNRVFWDGAGQRSWKRSQNLYDWRECRVRLFLVIFDIFYDTALRRACLFCDGDAASWARPGHQAACFGSSSFGLFFFGLFSVDVVFGGQFAIFASRKHGPPDNRDEDAQGQ